jgi:predicted CXXCH cytochrome family protein
VTGRHASMVANAALAMSVLVTACSPASRYRVLSFLFDGVPEPGKPAAEGYGPVMGAGPQEGAQETAPAVRRTVFVHAPFRDNQCTACHNMNTGRLNAEVREGLCLECHAGVSEHARYLHGPVAVNDCVACHHYHASPYPKLLLEDIETVCSGCHRREELSAEPHDATIAGQTCVVCHDPHGGADRFFVK